MDMEGLKELKRLAEAATPGPWSYDGSDICPARVEGETTYVESWNAIADSRQMENVRFIAAANPAAVLALIAECERLKGENEKFDQGLRAMACQLGAGGYNAETLSADQLLAKVCDGLNSFADSTGSLVDQIRAEREQLHTAHQQELERHRTTWTQLEQAKRECSQKRELLMRMVDLQNSGRGPIRSFELWNEVVNEARPLLGLEVRNV